MRVSPLEAVVYPKQVRVIHDRAFDLSEENRSAGVNARSSVDDCPPRLCAQASPALLGGLIALRQRYPERRILLIKTDFYDAFRNVRINPEGAQSFRYALDEFIAVELG